MQKNTKDTKNTKSKVELGFKDLEPLDRVLTVLLMALSGIIFILAILQLLSVWEDSIKVYVPLMALMMFVQAKLNRKTNPKMVKTYLIIAAILVLCAIFIIIFG